MTQKSEWDEALNLFLQELTELSHRYQVGITDEPVLFIMEPEDNELIYRCDDESRLVY